MAYGLMTRKRDANDPTLAEAGGDTGLLHGRNCATTSLQPPKPGSRAFALLLLAGV